MEQTFSGQVALVTGGGKGIGLGIAKALAGRGARVAITGRHMDTLKAALSVLGDGAMALEMDVRDQTSVQAGVAKVAEWGGKIDIVVNNAGIGLLSTPLMETTTEAWHDVIDTNLTGCFYVTKAAWPHVVASKGQIMNVSSIAGTQGFSGCSAYCASKFGVSGFTDVLKREGEAVGVRALAICPGPVDTDIWGVWATGDEKARMMTGEHLGELAANMLATPRNIDLGPWVVVNAVSPWTG